MKKELNKKKKMKLTPITLSWGEKEMKVGSQNAMNSPENPFSHEDQNLEQTTKESGKYKVVYRGSQNVAPQKDIQLGLRSITHKKIAQKLARLVEGQGVEFYVKDPENEDGTLTNIEQLQLDAANEWIKSKGINKAWGMAAAGLVYQNLGSIVTSNSMPVLDRERGKEKVNVGLEYANGQRTEQLRYSPAEINEQAKLVTNYHYYHETWGYNPKRNMQKPQLPTIVSIDDYILESMMGKDVSKKAYAVMSSENADAASSGYTSFAFELRSGIFDGAYPLPEWKANSSINDIQTEFEASCIRISYVRNGMHVFAVVNVYSAIYSDDSENEYNTPDEEWAEDLEIVKSLKGSYAAGRVIVNPIGTDDPNMDGVMKVENIKLDFPVEASKYFNEEARAGILTAWGVMADLFSVVKPEKNNLRSQGEFLKIGILLLQETVGTYQNSGELTLNEMLEFFGLDKIGAKIKNAKNTVYLSVLADLAKEFMDVNEFREMILNLDKKTEEELEELLTQKGVGTNNNTDVNVM